VLLALSGWVLLQSISLAYGRATGVLSSRYLDVIMLGVITNTVSAALLVQGIVQKKKQSLAAIVMLSVFVWLGIMAGKRAGESYQDVLLRQKQGQAQTENVRGYMLTGDRAYLIDKEWLEVPYPNPERLEMLLQIPEIRGILPSELGCTDGERVYSRSKLLLKGVFSEFNINIKNGLFSISSLSFGFLFIFYIVFILFLLAMTRRFRISN
jgi:hypothetical protein